MHTEITKMAVISMNDIVAEVELVDNNVIKIQLYQQIHDFDTWQETSLKVAECIEELNNFNTTQTNQDDS